MAQEISIRIGQNIRKHRNIKQLSQEALAERADLTTNYLGQIERGEKNPTIYILEKITNSLDMPLSDLILESENIQNSSLSIEHLRIYEYLRKFSSEKISRFQDFLESLEENQEG